MAEEKKEAPKQKAPKKDKFQEEFKELSLEEKIKTLLKMEAVTLQETFSYGLSGSMKAIDRLGDVITEFSNQVEAEFKKAMHHDQDSTAKSKTGESKKPPPKSQTA